MPLRSAELREWLRERLANSPRGTRQELARHLGFTRPDPITRMLNTDPSKESREIKAHEFAAMQEFFGETASIDKAGDNSAVDGVTGPIPLSSRRLKYGGQVSAGGYIAADVYFDQDGANVEVPSSVVRHPSYQDVQQFAWRVRGTSMDLAGILDGMWIVAVPYLEYVDKYGEPRNGRPVIVERSRFGGSEIERTVKEVQFARGGMRLIPRSTNAAHKEFFVPFDHTADSDAETVTILAVVLSAVRDYTD